jgi:adenosylhomocysteinase
MNTVTDTKVKTKDYIVADIGLAAFGRKEIAIAETEMPGLMMIREEFAITQCVGHRAIFTLHKIMLLLRLRQAARQCSRLKAKR